MSLFSSKICFAGAVVFALRIALHFSQVQEASAHLHLPFFSHLQVSGVHLQAAAGAPVDLSLA
jgi:hypothetical protein